MIALLLDGFWVAVCIVAGLASIRVVGIALNARDHRRHARCLKNIERLEIANGFRESPGPRMGAYGFSQVRYMDWPPPVIEVKPGSPPPVFHPGPKVFAERGIMSSAAAQQAAQSDQNLAEIMRSLLGGPGGL